MKRKICNKCKIEKDISEFHKDSSKNDGHINFCKECRKGETKKYRQKNSKNIKKYLKDNHEKIYNRQKKYKNENKEKFQERDKKYYELNWGTINARHKKYQKENKDKRNDYLKTRLQTDPLFKLTKNIRTRILIFVKSKKITKNNKTFEIVGCSPTELKEHLEKQFTEGMLWNNYGFYGWHIDHRIPLDAGKTEDEIYNLCHYTNLQPMWCNDNLKKSNKVTQTNKGDRSLLC